MFRLIFICVCVFLNLASVSAQDLFELDKFNQIQAFGKIELRLVESDKSYIQFKPSEYDISKIKYEVNDEVLSIKLLSEFPPNIKVRIELSYQELHRITVGGGINIYNRDTLFSQYLVIEGKSGSEMDVVLHADTLDVKANKGAFVRLSGKVDHVNLKTSTGGDIRAKELCASTMVAKQSGGTAEVNVVERLEAKSSLKAWLHYKSKPQKIKKKESLGGSIGTLEDY